MGQTLLANSGSHVIVEETNAVAADEVDLTLYIRVHCIARPARYSNAHAIPYMACNVATARRPE